MRGHGWRGGSGAARQGQAREMPCEACGVQFSVFRRKRACGECARLYCAACLRRGGGMCAPCRALASRPLQRASIAHLKPRDLQCFLQRQNVSTRGCVEKEELVSLCVCHVNSAAYRRRGPAGGAGAGGLGAAFTLKGLTTNINDFLSSAFHPQPPTPTPNQTSPPAPPTTHAPPTAARAAPAHERFTTNPGGERDFRVPPPECASEGAVSGAESGAARVDTADCFEVEDLDDGGWEFVTRPPADPLPNDSEVLMATPDAEVAGVGGTPQPQPQRAASVLELRGPAPAPADAAERASLRDEPLAAAPNEPLAASTSLEALTEAALQAMGARQLKELLARNRVEFRSCVERDELLGRARALLADHRARRAQLDALPADEWCKICMAAPLECVLLECGHIAACTACSKRLHECPICRRYVVRAVRCFRS